MLPSKKIDKSSTQNTGDNSIAINAEGSVSINTGLSISHVKEICRDMIKEDLKIFQSEAILEAQNRGDTLVDEFTSKAELRFGKLIETHLAEFKNPDAYLALRQTQENYCRYGEDETKNVSIDLLLERISSNKSSFEKLKIDQAIQLAGKLTSAQISLLGFIYLIGNVTMTNKDVESLKVTYLPTVTTLWKKSNLESAELEFMESTGALALFAGNKKWKKFDELHVDRYPALKKDPSSVKPEDNFLGELLQEHKTISDYWNNVIVHYNLSPLGKQIGLIILNHQTALNIN